MSKDFTTAIKQQQTTPAGSFFKTAPEPATAPDLEAEREKIRQEERAKIYAEIGRETKSKKLQLLVFPSVYNKLKDLAEREGTSVNNLINELMREYVDRHQ